MRYFRYYVVGLILLIGLPANVVLAQLTSPNFQIDGYTIIDPRISTATSTNFDAGFAPGPVYIFDVSTSTPDESGGGGSSNPDDPVDEPPPDEPAEEIDIHPEAPEPSPATVVFITESITCEREDQFPNWGNGGPNIRFDTAKNWVAGNPGCEFEAGNRFQWSNASAVAPAGSFIGPAGAGWFTFPSTNSNGYTAVEVSFETIENPAYVWVRTVLESGDLPFTFNATPGQRNTDDVSAEFYCHNDVLNYDNFDRIDSIQPGQTYYCVAWNLSPDADPVVLEDDPEEVPDEAVDEEEGEEDEDTEEDNRSGRGGDDRDVDDDRDEDDRDGAAAGSGRNPRRDDDSEDRRGIERTLPAESDSWRESYEVLRTLPIAKSFEAPTLERVAQVVEQSKWAVPVGLSGGSAITAFSLLRTPLSFSTLSRVFERGFSSIFGLLVFWRKRKPWGTVYDSRTKEPLDPAYVELFDLQGEKCAEAITDLDGRYGFLVPEGTYTMRVQRSNYKFPSTHLPKVGYDVLYDNLYYGGPIEVKASVAHDIPMDQTAYDWNQVEKLRTNQTQYFHRFDPLLAQLTQILFFAGFIAMIWQFYVSQTWLTGILLAIYTLLFLLRITRGAPPLYGRLTRNAEPLAYAVVRIFRGDSLVTSKITDSNGRYVALVPKGAYTIRIEERLVPDEYRLIHESVVTAKSGVINENLRL